MAFARIKLLDLNRDVLMTIISHLDPRDALSFFHTSKAAREISTHPSLHTVVLSSSMHQIERFRDHLLSTESRCYALKCLTLTKGATWEIEKTTHKPAAAIADILESAKNLQLFSSGCIETLNGASKRRIADALISLEHLWVLHLVDGGAETMTIIKDLRSLHLRELCAVFPHPLRMSLSELVPALAKFQHLETLSLSGLRIVDGPLDDTVTTATMPAVRSLTFEGTPFPISLAATLFPNVQTLTCRGCGWPRPGAGNGHGEQSVVVDTLPPACWKHTLSEVHMDVVGRDSWPLTCRVRWLDFDFLPGGYVEEALSAVDQSKPRMLSCAYRIDPDNMFWVRLPMIAADLQFLDVRILELSGRRKRYVLMHLSGFPALKVIFLCIRAYYMPVDLDAELETIARDLARGNRALRYIGLTLVDGRYTHDDQPIWNDELMASRWWKVNREEQWPYHVTDMIVFPTETGLKLREYMYKADYDSSEWVDRLSAFA